MFQLNKKDTGTMSMTGVFIVDLKHVPRFNYSMAPFKENLPHVKQT